MTNYNEKLLEARALGLFLYDISGIVVTAKAVADGEAMSKLRTVLTEVMYELLCTAGGAAGGGEDGDTYPQNSSHGIV